jgi:hypothetical protein
MRLNKFLELRQLAHDSCFTRSIRAVVPPTEVPCGLHSRSCEEQEYVHLIHSSTKFRAENYTILRYPFQ